MSSKRPPTDEESKKFIKKLFQDVEEIDDVSHLRDLQASPTYCHLELPREKFPRLKFQISDFEVHELKKIGILTKQNTLSEDLSSGRVKLNSNDAYELNSLEKLLYAILWKQGDLGKERLLLEGILANKLKDKRPVFYEFGGYLAGRNPYILDQHTLRCFALLECSESEVKDIRKHSDIVSHKKREIWISRFKGFYEELHMRIKLEKKDFFYETDRLLFGAGKFVKLTSKQLFSN